MSKATGKAATTTRYVSRSRLVLAAFILMGVGLGGRAVELHILRSDFLAGQGDARHLRLSPISAHRGAITDRNGEPLAVSTPVDSVWINPREISDAVDRLPALARTINRDPNWLLREITRNSKREFVYIRRHLVPSEAARVQALAIPGVHLLREYRRYYPAGEVTGHVLGFADVDDQGQEGLELAFNHWLAGEAGSKRVIMDRVGQVIEDVESVKPPHHGKTLRTSLDLRIQYLAYRELKSAVQRYQASAGSAVLLDIATGEVLAMVNQPAYNPNDRAQLSAARYRNRVITDIFEPGSSIKPIIVAAALESGAITNDSRIETAPGFVQVGAKLIKDTQNHGLIDLGTLLRKSSNVGATKLAMSMAPEYMWSTISRFGIGELTASGFPGESAGLLSHHAHWRPISQATMAYGYGLSVTALQLAQAYAVLGAGGYKRPVTLLADPKPGIERRVVAEQTASDVVAMLETVVAADGSGTRAQVPGFRIAGKTGTAWKFEAGGYSEDRYTAVFAGLAPASNPRLVAVVVIDEPAGEAYYGGEVAAPVFSRIMSDALRLMAIPPDDLPETDDGLLAQAGGERP